MQIADEVSVDLSTAGAKRTTSFSFSNYLSPNSTSKPALNGADVTIWCSDIHQHCNYPLETDSLLSCFCESI
jgi:hypothetical protein